MVGHHTNRLDTIMDARYGPLVLSQPLNSYYSYGYNQNIENEDFWMRLFMQSLDGEVRKWLREFPTNFINGIYGLETTFIEQWGYKKDYPFYHIETRALKIKPN